MPEGSFQLNHVPSHVGIVLQETQPALVDMPSPLYTLKKANAFHEEPFVSPKHRA